MDNSLTIAVASGKGGTGKTTVSTNMAVGLSRAGIRTQYIDCDVEEPNGFVFLRPENIKSERICVNVPEFDPDKCNGCGECGRFCQFNAIAAIGTNVVIFEELCHCCKGCMILCPTHALKEKECEIGHINRGGLEGMECLEGRLKISSVRSPGLIKDVRKYIAKEKVTILDAPPGTSCSAVAAIIDTDYVLLVTDATPFGLNDLKLAVGMTKKLGVPFGVIINRCDLGDDKTDKYCEENGIEVLARIPNSLDIARAYSSGNLLVDINDEYAKLFGDVYARIAAAAAGKAGEA